MNVFLRGVCNKFFSIQLKHHRFMTIFCCMVTEEKMRFYIKKKHIIWKHLGTAMFYCNSHYLLVSITVRALKKPIKSWKVSVKKLSQKGKEIEFFTAVFILFSFSTVPGTENKQTIFYLKFRLVHLFIRLDMGLLKFARVLAIQHLYNLKNA